jgi:serine/threonine protein kinase
VPGSQHYLAPEQIFDGGCSPASDLYAFGLVFYRALTGTLPFREPADDVGTARLRGRAPDVGKQAPETPEWLARLIMRLLERDAADRPASAASVLDELRRIGRSLRPREPERTTPDGAARGLRVNRLRIAMAAAYPSARPPEWASSLLAAVETSQDALADLDHRAAALAAELTRAEAERAVAYRARADALRAAVPAPKP